MNILDTFDSLVSQNQSQGDATVAGASENKNSVVDSIANLFNQGAQVYTAIKGSDGTTRSTSATPKATAKSSNLIWWVGGGVVALILVIFLARQ